MSSSLPGVWNYFSKILGSPFTAATSSSELEKKVDRVGRKESIESLSSELSRFALSDLHASKDIKWLNQPSNEPNREESFAYKKGITEEDGLIIENYGGPLVIRSQTNLGKKMWKFLGKLVLRLVKGIFYGALSAIPFSIVAVLAAICFGALLMGSIFCIFPEVRQAYPKLLLGSGAIAIIAPILPLIVGVSITFGVDDRLTSFVSKMRE